MSDTNEEIVGRVLHSLRDAAPPDGMESRILSAVRHRASAMPIPTRSLWRLASLTGGAALATLLCALFFTAHRKAPQTTMPPFKAASLRATIRPTVAVESIGRAGLKSAVHRRKPEIIFTSKKDTAHISYPAPPLPLTEQEKLLLRIIHKDDPVQIAMLDPVKWMQQNTEDRKAFSDFFKLTEAVRPEDLKTKTNEEITHEP